MTFSFEPRYYFKKEREKKAMEWQVFEILEEKIEQVVRKMEVLSGENQEFKKKIMEKEDVIQNAQERIDILEEEKGLMKAKVDGILEKINQVLG
ncbi:MAG: cell division protein ZapB [Thermodesulfobacteriota bacterium]